MRVASVGLIDDGRNGSMLSQTASALGAKVSASWRRVISPSPPASAWTAKANKRVQFGYGLSYLLGIERVSYPPLNAVAAQHGYSESQGSLSPELQGV